VEENAMNRTMRNRKLFIVNFSLKIIFSMQTRAISS